MHKFVRNLITEWRRLKLPVSGDTMIVGVSGGADSVSLLLALHELTNRSKLGHMIVAAHFNHQLRGTESDADEEFVRELTARLEIALVLHSENISNQGNLEQNARDARYKFLTKTAKNLDASAVLTGHTVNDQAETFLLNLIRGSGTDGLGGMKPVSSLEFRVPSSKSKTKNSKLETRNPELLLVRPLLNWAKRIDTESFCRDQGIKYRYDTMNEDTAFKRVRIRKVLLPMLEDMNPNIIETLANTTALMQNSSRNSEMRNRFGVTDELDLGEIRYLSQDELYDAIRVWLRHHRGSMRQLQLKHIQAIERLVLSQKSGKTAELPGGRVIKSSGKLVYKENKVEN